MSGGFTAGLRRTVDPLAGSINVLASQHGMVKRVGLTLDASLFGAPDDDGNILVLNGRLVGKVTATGKYGPYSGSATDGRQDIDQVGIIFNGGVNLKDGDVITGALFHGSVLEARLSGLTATARTGLKHRIIFQ